jgi:hypothetical protein
VELDGHLFGMSWSDLGHAALDVVGMVPVVGEVADVANGIWYMAEGNYVDGAMSLASAIPLAGNVIGAVKMAKTADNVYDAYKATDNATDVAKAATPPKAPDTPKAPDAGDAPATPKADTTNAPSKCNSFVPGTRVLLADGGSKPIEDLQLGDRVLATDVETGENQARPVTDVRNHAGVKKLVTITVDDDGETGSFTSTAAHLFWLPDVGRWVEGAQLKRGMWLQTGSGTWVQITAIKKHTRTERVHNLTVDGQHNYYILAGDASLLVHNCPGGVDANGNKCNCVNGALRGPGGKFAKNPATPPKPPSSGVHGNSLNSSRPTVLYMLTDAKTGDFLKWGITSEPNPMDRYTKKFLKGKNLEIIARGTRRDMEKAERFLTSRWPGPLNKEKHAGTLPAFSPGPLDGR